MCRRFGQSHNRFGEVHAVVESNHQKNEVFLNLPFSSWNRRFTLKEFKKSSIHNSSCGLGMSKGFVLPPRRHFTREEKRRNVAVEYARCNLQVEKGLRLVHTLQSHNPEMRWLAELFPIEVLVDGFVPVENVEKRLSEWCASHPEDARGLAHLANVRHEDSLWEKAALMGDVWAMGWIRTSFCVR